MSASRAIEPISSSDNTAIIEGPIVAVQYPAKPNYTLSTNTGSELADKYKHLMRIDPDDKDAYKALCDAIKEVKSKRSACQKEEDIIKKPLNEFRALVINMGKKIRGNIQELAEDKLIAEKKRVDDIKQERLLAQQKLWSENFSNIRKMGNYTTRDSIDRLRELLSTLDAFDISTVDLGDYEGEAKAEIARMIANLETAIEQKKESERIDKLKKEQEAKEAESKAALEKAEKEKRELQEKLDALNKKEEKEIKTQTNTLVRDPFADSQQAKRKVTSIKITEQTQDNSLTDEQRREDNINLDNFTENLIVFLSKSNCEFNNQEYKEATQRVSNNIKNAIDFLSKIKRSNNE